MKRPIQASPRMLFLIIYALTLSVWARAGESSPAPPPTKFAIVGTAPALTNTAAVPGHNEWAWMGGSNKVDQAGVYGTLGKPSAANVPGARRGAVTWKDPSGNVWLFGGFGYDSAGTPGQLNDLWKYSAGEWTWIGGSHLANQIGSYGTLGKPSPTNIPGGRGQMVACTDASGNVWLFGGHGFDATGAEGNLSDLWRYSAGEWTWMGGSNVDNQVGEYGTLGKPDPENFPGARQQAVAWTDASGNFWLFGGDTYDQAGMIYNLSDLWKYGHGVWTWAGGSDLSNQDGSYGVLGTSSATNAPGARFAAVTWKDSSGDIWLFGGGGYDAVGTNGLLNDLWKYSEDQWTWMGGSNLANQIGSYGTQGTLTGGDIPAARGQAVAWTDAAGNFWLFGGEGYRSAGKIGYLNDLWKYSGGEWTQMSGRDSSNQFGTYGILRTPAAGNVPAARFFRPVAWTDASGNLWLFSGAGYGSLGKLDLLNDLWKYTP
ncbi:MAG TPA: hypothetical protein VHY19_15440 [Steroidobacteraceae bacterium]|nr:hypothetical protein [Steroidobacteraceae bacterium]